MLIPPLRVGVLIPSDPQTVGGGYELPSAIFSEIIQRINDEALAEKTIIKFIPISLKPGSAESWGLDSRSVLRVHPSPLLKIKSALHRRFHQKLKPRQKLQWDSTPTGRAAATFLVKNLDALWTLHPDPYTITDRLPIILPVWDLQHRLQPFFPEVSSGDEWEFREKHYARFARKAYLCLTGTERGKLELQQFYGIDPSRVLVNPFPCPKPCVVPVETQIYILEGLKLRTNSYILYPAQFWPHKNHLCAILALRQLLDNGIALKLVLTGDDKGALKPVLDYAMHLGVLDSVVYAGFVDRSTLASLYISSIALIFPSLFGPDNLPPLEAMSYGIPAIVANVPGSDDQYGNAVLRFSPGRPDELAQAIEKLMSNKILRDHLIERGKKLILQLSPRSYVDRVEQVLSAAALELHCASLMRSA